MLYFKNESYNVGVKLIVKEDFYLKFLRRILWQTLF